MVLRIIVLLLDMFLGTVCCAWNSDSKRRKLYTYGAIRKLKRISNSVLQHDPRQHRGLGFGYNPVSKDYEIVRVVFFKDHLHHSEVEIYSLKNNMWTRIQNIPYSIPFSPQGEFYNGAIHWLGLRCIAGSSYSFFQADVIVSYDLASREVREIQLPDYGQDHFRCMGITVLDGHLCLYCYYNMKVHYITQVWVMRDYGVRDSWIKLYVGEELKFPLAITKEGEIVLLVLNLYAKRMCFMTLSTEPQEMSKYVDFVGGITFVESLVPV